MNPEKYIHYVYIYMIVIYQRVNSLLILPIIYRNLNYKGVNIVQLYI